MVAVRLQRGASVLCQCGNIVATAWRGKVVNVASVLDSAITDSRKMEQELMLCVPSLLRCVTIT